jgi:DNA-binding NarL/FixJ family response regulator
MKSAPIRVLIADSDPLICRALVRWLHDSGDVEVIATAQDDDAVLALAGQFHPPVAVIDARTGRAGQLDGIMVTQRLCRQLPLTRVILLGIYATTREQALSAGACRFLLKDGSRDALVAAIQLVARGECEARG